jgi:molecular chaperone Hsp33
MSKIEKFISSDGSLRVSVVICSDVIEQARIIHGTFPVGSAALGRALVGAGLLASFQKGADARTALHFKGDGPLGSVFAEGTSEGYVRGFIVNPQIHVPSKNGKLNVGGGIGKGILSVAMTLPDQKMPYTGSVDIQSGEIGEDIAFYLFQSQQTPSIVALGVYVEPDNSVSAAGGMILQAMPGVTDDVLAKLEARVPLMRSMTDLIREGATTSDLANEILGDFQFRKVSDEAVTMSYTCHCSSVRVEKALLLAGGEELKILIAKNESAEIKCDFCGRKYLVDVPTLTGLLGLTILEP